MLAIEKSSDSFLIPKEESEAKILNEVFSKTEINFGDRLNDWFYYVSVPEMLNGFAMEWKGAYILVVAERSLVFDQIKPDASKGSNVFNMGAIVPMGIEEIAKKLGPLSTKDQIIEGLKDIEDDVALFFGERTSESDWEYKLVLGMIHY
jgi:hypothetical protein